MIDFIDAVTAAVYGTFNVTYVDKAEVAGRAHLGRHAVSMLCECPSAGTIGENKK